MGRGRITPSARRAELVQAYRASRLTQAGFRAAGRGEVSDVRALGAAERTGGQATLDRAVRGTATAYREAPAYLKDVLTRLPAMTSKDDLRPLLPGSWQPPAAA